MDKESHVKIDLKNLPRCATCKSLVISLVINQSVVRQHEDESGLKVLDETTITSVTFTCSNYHFWKWTPE